MVEMAKKKQERRTKLSGDRIVGERSGKLEVIENLGTVRANGGTNSRRLVRVLCDCGIKKIIFYEAIRQKRTGSCGCAPRGQDISDQVGLRFGDLKILEDKGRDLKGFRIVRVECICGRIKTLRYHNIAGTKNNPTRSCGNHRKPRYNKLGVGLAARNGLLASYKARAKRRGIPWKIKDEKFFELIAGNCSYCGTKPNYVYSKRGDKYTYNGVDRFNNDHGIGYTTRNSKTCCKICNRIKGTHSMKFLLAHIAKIAGHTAKKTGR